jgi:hypothetical protein
MDLPVIKRTTGTVESKEMPVEQNLVDSHRLVRLAEKMHDKEYRDGYVAAHTRQVLAKQMREFRGDKSQIAFAESLGKRQTVVSRLESPSYVGWSLSTMFEVASKLDVAVFARFVDFPTFLEYSGVQSETALHPPAYNQEEVDSFAYTEAAQETITMDPQIYGQIYNAQPSSAYYVLPVVDPPKDYAVYGLQVANLEPTLGYWPHTSALFDPPSKLQRRVAMHEQAIARLKEENERLKQALLFKYDSASADDVPDASVKPLPIGMQSQFGLWR